MVPRASRILDAGCGTSRVGGQLAAVGHDVVGVDLDPELINAARQDHTGPQWLVGDKRRPIGRRLNNPAALHKVKRRERSAEADAAVDR